MTQVCRDQLRCSTLYDKMTSVLGAAWCGYRIYLQKLRYRRRSPPNLERTEGEKNEEVKQVK